MVAKSMYVHTCTVSIYVHMYVGEYSQNLRQTPKINSCLAQTKYSADSKQILIKEHLLTIKDGVGGL